MRIIALDQASRTSGYSVFDGDKLIASGTIKLTDDHVGMRLYKLRQSVQQLCQQYQVEYMILEDIQLQHDPQTYKTLGKVLGVLEELAVELFGQNYTIYTCAHWRSVLSIKGNERSVQKKNAQQYVLEHYNKRVSEDESDAICIGAAYVNSNVGFDWS